MIRTILSTMLISISLFSCTGISDSKPEKTRQTIVSINGEKFLINGQPTYKGRTWQGYPIEGLLMNSRMVQGIFDDINPKTAWQWEYPDTQIWDADRNTNEFIKAMDDWYSKGLLAFTINLQGGSPKGYGNEGWINSAIDPKGELRPEYMARLEKIIDRADEKGMVVILGIFYFGQDEFMENEAAIVNGVNNTAEWLFNKKYRNVIIEVNNECDVKDWDYEIFKPQRIHELINLVKSKSKDDYPFLVGTSFGGGTIPTENVIKNSDFILIHGNGIENPQDISQLVNQTKKVDGYRPLPILFNEDDHFDFDKPMNNFVEAVKAYASWGYFDYRLKGETSFDEGYQSVPVNWGISSERKKGFFNKLEEITGGLK